MEFIEIKQREKVWEIILNRPEKRNALNSQVVTELTEAFQRANDDKSVRVMILKARGQTFSAGADLGYLQQLQNNTYEENLEDSSQLKELFRLMYLHKKIIIAQVEGHAIAGGCGLATVCDFVFSVPEASYGYTEVKIGFVPAIVMFFLLRKIGEAKARPLLLTGRLVTAEEMKNLGLIYEIIPAGEIAEHVNSFALALASETSSQSVALTREMIAGIQDMNTDDALSYAAARNAFARSQEDCKRGIAAFLNKEKIIW